MRRKITDQTGESRATQPSGWQKSLELNSVETTRTAAIQVRVVDKAQLDRLLNSDRDYGKPLTGHGREPGSSSLALIVSHSKSGARNKSLATI